MAKPVVTVLGPHAYARPPYGSFSGKPASSGRSGRFSVLGPHGYSRPPYASFAGKPTSNVTQEHHDKPFFAVVGQLMGM